MISLCRLCSRYMDATERKTEVAKLELKLSLCCGWKRSHNELQMPQKACSACVDQLQASWTFAESVWAADAHLNKLLSDPIDDVEISEVVANEIEFVADDEYEDVKLEIEEADPKLTSNCVVVLEELKPNIKINDNNTHIDDDAIAADDINDSQDNYDGADDTIFDEPATFSDAESTHSDINEQKEKKKINSEKMQVLKDPFLSGLSPEDCLEGGLISANGVAKLEKLNPDMKTISWSNCQYKCDKCDKMFTGSHNFYAHIRSIHIDEVISINVSCFYCNATHRREYALNKHIASAHHPHLKYRCMYCSDYYWNTRELNKHRGMHTDVEYKCELCEMVFSHQNLFYAHVSAHHSTKKKKEKAPELNEQLLCEVCNKFFKNKGSIRNHMVLHTKKFDHICHLCGWKFQTRGNLKGHLASTHSDERPFKCDQCHKWFKTKHQLNNHAKHHEDVRPYQCSECNRKFRRPYSLAVHMRSHTNTCPYTCRYCGKSFRHNITLQTHERGHTSDKPYACTNCDYRSTSKGNLNKHMMRVHSIDFRNHVLKGRENYTKDGVGYLYQ